MVAFLVRSRLLVLALGTLVAAPALAQESPHPTGAYPLPPTHQRLRQPPTGPKSERAWQNASPQAIFHRMDRNGDGRLSQEEIAEFRRAHPDTTPYRGAHRFDVDIDGNGRIDAWEWQAYREHEKARKEHRGQAGKDRKAHESRREHHEQWREHPHRAPQKAIHDGKK